MAKKVKSYTETELIKMFGLKRLSGNKKYPLMHEWTTFSFDFTPSEQEQFDEIYENAERNIIGWQEEDLKMQLISPILFLSKLKNTDRYLNFFLL